MSPHVPEMVKSFFAPDDIKITCTQVVGTKMVSEGDFVPKIDDTRLMFNDHPAIIYFRRDHEVCHMYLADLVELAVRGASVKLERNDPLYDGP